jgi:hypothetical protein
MYLKVYTNTIGCIHVWFTNLITIGYKHSHNNEKVDYDSNIYYVYLSNESKVLRK